MLSFLNNKTFFLLFLGTFFALPVFANVAPPPNLTQEELNQFLKTGSFSAQKTTTATMSAGPNNNNTPPSSTSLGAGPNNNNNNNNTLPASESATPQTNLNPGPVQIAPQGTNGTPCEENSSNEGVYCYLAPIDQNKKSVSVTGDGFAEYAGTIFDYTLGLAGVAAVLSLVVGGIQYIGSGASPSQKTAANNRITKAFTGLALALVSYLILYTINPELVEFRLEIPKIPVRYNEAVPLSLNATPRAPGSVTTTATIDPNTKLRFDPGENTNLNTNLTAKLQLLQKGTSGINWSISEGYPPTGKHSKDGCHYKPGGICVDIALRSGNREDILFFLDQAELAGLSARYELKTDEQIKTLLKGFKDSGNPQLYEKAYSLVQRQIIWANPESSGAHFHVKLPQ